MVPGLGASVEALGMIDCLFAFIIWLLGLPTFKQNRDCEGHTHGKSSTNQNHANLDRHQDHLLLPQIIGQDRPWVPGHFRLKRSSSQSTAVGLRSIS
ncbi:MAG: hypothetical protein CMN94_03610 [Synechococcus sp. EAC657]|nr:hypothetical protein [Synechococcus sp. EAC657]